MVLPHRDLDVLQPNLGFDNIQEDIILGLNNLAWNVRRSEAECSRVQVMLEQEEVKAERIQRDIERALHNQRNPQPPQ